MSKAMTKKTETSVSEYSAPEGSWGSENTSSKDLIIPKILLMQGMSELVQDDKARLGEFRSSLDGTLLGGKDKPMSFIPFYLTKTIINYRQEGDQLKYIGEEPVTVKNADIPFETTVDGVDFRHDKCINVYCLRPEELDGEYLPYLLSFRRMSYRTGKKISTFFDKLKAFGKAPATRIFELSTTQQENEKGKFWVYDVEQKEATNQDQLAAAYLWYKTILGGGVQVDNSDMKEAEIAPSGSQQTSF